MENKACLKELARHKKLLSATLILNSSLEPSYIHKKTIEAITDIVNAEVGSLLLYDEENEELYFDVALGEKGEIIKKIRLKIGEGIAGSVAMTRKSLIVNDVSKDPRFFKKADEQSGFITKSILCSPLVHKSKLLGVIQAINKKDNDQFSEEDLNLFESFANIVAIALENANLYNKLKETFFQTSFALAEAVEKRDPYTGGHVKRVTEYCLAIAEEMGLNKEERENLELSAILHDIGKIGIDDAILRKPSFLDDKEIEIMKKHPLIGHEILSKVKHLSNIVEGTFSHHERYDGTGYPKGIKGEEIPIIGRIIAVCDTYDAMTSNRPYRNGLDDNIAIEEIKKNKGKQFDPIVVDAFIKAFEKGKIISQNKREKSHEN
jgi:HD-GYP domain-containing protein (c-di-GMP phosphodiesterase class II)